MKKKLFSDLIDCQKKYQRELSKYTPTQSRFHDIKKELKIVGNHISYYKNRPKPIDPKLLKINDYLSKTDMDLKVELGRKEIPFENKLLKSEELYQLCLITCHNQEAAGDLYTTITKTYDYITNDRSIIKIRTSDDKVLTARILNSSSYTDIELNTIKEKIFL